MIGDWREWLHLVLRWAHVVAGAFWVGQTALFTWLDTQSSREMRRPRRHNDTSEGRGTDHARSEVWMVHSGGFYRVERVVAPERMPGKLHWFKWEAAATWISGFLILNLVYYHGGAMVEAGSAVGPIAAGAIGVGTLVGGWIAYDLLWLAPLAKRETTGTVVSLALLALVAWGLGEVMSGRAAYIHVGALFGTIMAANVWSRILPAQRRMVASIERGDAPDAALADRAKQRSRHNTFLTVPLAFLMISSHFPTTSYGHRWHWLLLGLFVLAGFAARAAINAWEKKS